MATNNLLVNNEDKVLREIRSKTERSGHNLSESKKFPAEIGYIYPIYCRKTLPSDSIKIDSEVLIKQLQPLLVPQMVSFTVNVAFFWIDYSLAFPDFERFMISQKQDVNIELPYIKLPLRGNFFDKTADNLPYVFNDSDYNSVSLSSNPASLPLSKSVRSFLGFTRYNTNEKVEALPFWAYQRVYRDYYLNVDRLSDEDYTKWFPEDSVDEYLKSGVNYSMNYSRDFSPSANSNTFSVPGSIHFDQLRIHNVRGDYFVNTYPTPLRGETPVLSTDSSIGSFSADTNLSQDLRDFENLTIDLQKTDGSAFTDTTHTLSLNAGTSSSGSIQGLDDDSVHLLYGDTSSSSSLFGILKQNHNILTDRITFSNIQNLEYSLSITARQLRLLEALTRKRETDILIKPRLTNYLNAYFGIDHYKDNSLYQPVFIGSHSQKILINDIAQTTATDSSPLGRQGATAMSLGSGNIGEYFCRNYGCLLGVMYILPDYDYAPALPREWQEMTRDDFYNPDFAHLSMMAVLNKEMHVSNDDSWNNEVLGYSGIYDNYRTSINTVAGSLLDTSKVDIQQFAQVRRFTFAQTPEITTSFLDSNSAFDSNIFAVPEEPPFIVQAVSRVRAVRPLPEVATPRDL